MLVMSVCAKFCMPILVDCQWSTYGEWSECSKSCEGGFMTSNRTKIGEPMFGGKECDGNETRTEVCNMNSCPGRHNMVIGVASPTILDLVVFYM